VRRVRGGQLLQRGRRHVLALPARLLLSVLELALVRPVLGGHLLRRGRDSQHPAVPRRLVLPRRRQGDAPVRVGHLLGHGWLSVLQLRTWSVIFSWLICR
jgi:hypothetical protein